MATQSERVLSAVGRIQKAISRNEIDLAAQVIAGLSEDDVRYMALAMSLSRYGDLS